MNRVLSRRTKRRSHHRVGGIAFLLWLALAGPVSAAEVVISEFMASNSSTLKDEDGKYSDWIEIWNRGSESVDLGGWHLANDASTLTQWQFPSTNLPPGGFMVVFASGKNRRVPGAPLHTSFKLDAAGEYLALVMPDGVTKATEFAPAFPPQYADIPYGFPMSGVTTTLLGTGAAIRARIPTGDLGTAWRSTNFDDSLWLAGTTGAGYDRSTNYLPGIGLNVGAAMSNLNATAYLRLPFTASNPAQFNGYTLRMSYDDGFVAYLNGTEVARRNAPASLSWNSAAVAAHGTLPAASLIEDFEGPAANYTLSTYGSGASPAVQVAGPGSTGKYLRLLYDGVNSAANAVAFPQAAPGLFQTIQADFDFRAATTSGNPADGFSFMLIPTSTYGTNGPGVISVVNPYERPGYPGVFGVGFAVYPHPSVNDVSVHWNGTQLYNVTMPASTLDLVAGVFHHVRIALQAVAGGTRVTITFTPNINGTPGAAYTPVANFFIAGLNPFDCRVQLAGRTGGATMNVDLDRINVQFIPSQGLPPFEEIDLTSQRGMVASGTNLLAIQGLNVSATNASFLILPQLNAYTFVASNLATYLYPPTPGAWNNVSAAGQLGTVTFWPPAGVYTNDSLTVSMTSSSSSANIRYTLDGTAPTASSTLYTAPLVLAANAVIRAQAFEPGKLSSQPVAANYVLLDSSLTNFTSNLPMAIFDTLGGTIIPDSKIPGYAMFFNTNGPTGRVALAHPNDYVGRIGIELHGQSSLSFPKSAYTFQLDDEQDNAQDYPLLGLPSHNDWGLYASYSDKTFLNNVMTYELHEAMGHYSVRRRYLEVFLHHTAGKLSASDYLGLYVMVEKLRISPNRVNIANLGPADNAEPAISGGYIFKKDKDSPGDVNFTTSSGELLKYHAPKGNDLTAAQQAWLVNYINQFEAALYGTSWLDPVNGYARYIDVGAFVDFHWIVEYPKNIDGVRLSNYFTKDRNGKIQEGPVWDWDLSWGNANYAEGGKTNGWYYPLMGDYDDIWLRKLRTDPNFAQQITDRWGELRLGLFHPSNLLARVDQITNLIWEAQGRDFVRWPRLGSYVWPNPDGANTVPSAADGTDLNWDVNYATTPTYASLIGEYKKWVIGRYNWIEAQFTRPPILSRMAGPITPGTTLDITAPAGTIYYTLDGTDPRASGGAVSGMARVYAGTITLSNNAGVVARALSTAGWSAPAQAVYVVTPPALRITEIMYHPLAPPSNSPYTSEDFEFIELKNTGATATTLAGVRLAAGISYAFDPYQLVSSGAFTSNSFDGGGTPFAASQLNASPGPALTSGGPAGRYLRLLTGGRTNLMRNRIAFDQTASGSYGRVTADFDFRAAMVWPAWSNGLPTVQNFDTATTAYVVTNFGATPVTLLAGDAGSTGSFVRLVPGSGGEIGSIGFALTATGAWSTVTATFDFRITPPSEANQADGLGFALLSTASYGRSGPAPGISEEPNLANSIGVGFDVYNNAGTPVEPNNNHISLHWNGAQVGNAYIPPFDMSNGRFHRAQVVVRFANSQALVTVRLTSDINGTPGTPVTVCQDVPIAGVAPYESRVAFGARTGGAVAAHDLDNIEVDYSMQSPGAAGLSLLFLPTNQFGATGPGSTLSQFSDLPALPGTLALDLSFGPSNTVNDTAFYWNATNVGAYHLSPDLLNLESGQFNHAQLQLDAAAGAVYATLTLTPNSLGAPGAPVTVISNLYLPGVVLANARVELAGRNGALDTTLDLENLWVTYQIQAPNTLAAGESIVVVRNRAAFQSRYGTGLRVAGEYEGHLNNAGEELTLLGPVGEPILDFTFNNNWYPITDGLGFSLVIQDPNAPANSWGSAQSWRASSLLSGSPGVSDPAPPTIAPILVNEAVANTLPPQTDRIELFNPTGQSANIGAWLLTDAFGTPDKFRIPANTFIPAGGFVVFTEADFNPNPGSPTSFGLNGEGDDVWLFAADAAHNLTGYVHGFHFSASEENASFGRYVNSQGEEDFVVQITNTFGAVNAGPRVGPIVISEIMYCPPPLGTNDNTRDEYVELLNVTAAPVALFSASLPTNTWLLRNAVDFDFPTNLVMQPGQRLLVVGFDPATDATSLAAFRTRYALGVEARILGPWQGRLGNSDERLELRKPGELTAAGNIPSILVEAIHYHATAPWPTGAAGAGASLQRLVASAYGNDSTNWFAAGYSPGQPNRFDQPPAVALTAPTNGSVLTAGSAVPVIAAASDPDGSVVKVRFFSDGAPFAESTNAPFSATWFCSAGPHLLGAVALDNGGVSSTSAVVSVMGQVSINTNILAVASNSVWRYLDDGTDQGVAWTNLTFNDTSWSNGVAQIGFGDGDEATKVRATNATTSGRIVTYYFRRTFVLGSVAGITNALLRLQRDDGAIAYLNGAEVARQNMPSGAVGYHTLASSSISGTSENTMFPTNVNPGVFRAGTNIIAVEVHQATTGTSEDMSFAADLAISQAYSGPALRASPVSQTVQAGDTVQFSVMAVGTAPLSYQWLFNLTNLLPNASAPTLTLTNVSPVNAGSYQVVVSNPVGSVTSAVASLVVTSPPPRLDAVILPPAPGQPVTISFSAVTGNSYTLQYCNTLGPSNWRCLTNWPPFVVSQQVSAQDPTSVGQPQRFYRLVTPATICNP